MQFREKQEKPERASLVFGGEDGIRTHGSFRNRWFSSAWKVESRRLSTSLFLLIFASFLDRKLPFSGSWIEN